MSTILVYYFILSLFLNLLIQFLYFFILGNFRMSLIWSWKKKVLAKRLFESVGMQSQVENQKTATLFDVILVLLEQVIVEVNQAD